MHLFGCVVYIVFADVVIGALGLLRRLPVRTGQRPHRAENRPCSAAGEEEPKRFSSLETLGFQSRRDLASERVPESPTGTCIKDFRKASSPVQK